MTDHQRLRPPRLIALPHVAGLLRVLALFGLFLLPIQMRAGTDYVHPHALLQLLLDASDHEIDHHLAPALSNRGHGDHSAHPPRPVAASPDLPTFESIQMAAGGLAVSLVTLTLLLIMSAQDRVWPRREAWAGRRVRPEFPPPRFCET